ncbi:rhamnan synthesis F family protein [Pseudoroseomonas globiformis]|uniref:Rhamnan synthesis F family protein n=1 Tax=Teichococcus globiformis TaxID=2307229 RepID=A0ABV7FX47_9PROT
MTAPLRAGARRALALGRTAARAGSARAALLLARIEPPRLPLRVERGTAALGPRVAVFCHFDPRGRLAEHVRRYIAALAEAGLSIVFTSNAGQLEDAALDWLRPRCAMIVLRRNTGLDFAAWRDGLAAAALPRAETELLLLVNDSVYGPLSPLGPMLARMDFSAADVWGLTDSWQCRFHLQSYLLAFGPRAFRSPGFNAFWKDVRDLRSKEAVIRAYEVGLTRAMLDAGLRCTALWPYTELLAAVRDGFAEPDELPVAPLEAACLHHQRAVLHAAARRQPMNPTAELWRPLLSRGFPFLKRELLRKNPAGVPDLAGWLDLARAASPEAAEIILHDLRGSLRGRAP